MCARIRQGSTRPVKQHQAGVRQSAPSLIVRKACFLQPEVEGKVANHCMFAPFFLEHSASKYHFETF